MEYSAFCILLWTMCNTEFLFHLMVHPSLQLRQRHRIGYIFSKLETYLRVSKSKRMANPSNIPMQNVCCLSQFCVLYLTQIYPSHAGLPSHKLQYHPFSSQPFDADPYSKKCVVRNMTTDNTTHLTTPVNCRGVMPLSCQVLDSHNWLDLTVVILSADTHGITHS